MNKLLKIALLLAVFGIFTSCDFSLFDKIYYCPDDDSKNLGNNLKLGTYIESRGKWNFHDNGIFVEIPAKEVLSLHEDSTFDYFVIANNNNGDTIKKVVNGKFSIYQDAGFRWYALDFKNYSVYEKRKKGYTTEDYDPSVFEYTDFSEKEQLFNLSPSPCGSVYNLLSNIDNESNCFSIAYKDNPAKCSSGCSCDPDYDCCDKTILINVSTFCLAPAEEPQTNSKGDNL